METLLQNVFDAYGGPDCWHGLTTLTARISYGGPFWELKGRPDFVGTDRVEADLQTQRIRHYQESSGLTLDFDKRADRVTITDADGATVEKLDHPRRTFAGLTAYTGWSRAQTAYFRSYATWHYLVEPYVFSWDGVETFEIAPWEEDGQKWRGFAATFPPSLDTHNRTQLYYFDDQGRLRRMDYQPEILNYFPVAHYISGHQTVDGLLVATQRRVHVRNDDRSADYSWASIMLDLFDIEVQ
jgi:hypothetical protein